MKKTLIFAALAAIALASCQKEKDSIPFPSGETFSKTIHFSISQATDYADARYDGLTAALNIKVAKVSKKDWNVVEVWDTTVAAQSVRLYPLAHQPFSFSKTFTGINDADESISMSYWIAYKDRFNQESAQGKNDFVPEGNSSFSFIVRL